jgi:hypothetical protein
VAGLRSVAVQERDEVEGMKGEEEGEAAAPLPSRVLKFGGEFALVFVLFGSPNPHFLPLHCVLTSDPFSYPIQFWQS